MPPIPSRKPLKYTRSRILWMQHDVLTPQSTITHRKETSEGRLRTSKTWQNCTRWRLAIRKWPSKATSWLQVGLRVIMPRRMSHPHHACHVWTTNKMLDWRISYSLKPQIYRLWRVTTSNPSSSTRKSPRYPSPISS